MEQVTSNDGTLIGFRRTGTGPPLLFVHGMFADHKSWFAISGHFKSNCTVYTMDRRGRGGSGDSPDYGLHLEAEDVAAVVDSIVEPVSVFGHSFGGLCCLEASLLTGNISRIILYEPSLPTGNTMALQGISERIHALIDSGDMESAMELFLVEVAEMSEHDLETYRSSPLWEERISLAPTIPRELMAEQNYRFNAKKFSGLRIPVILLLGGESPGQYLHAIKKVDSAFMNSRIVQLPGQGHIVHHTNPELFAREMLNILHKS